MVEDKQEVFTAQELKELVEGCRQLAPAMRYFARFVHLADSFRDAIKNNQLGTCCDVVHDMATKDDDALLDDRQKANLTRVFGPKHAASIYLQFELISSYVAAVRMMFSTMFKKLEPVNLAFMQACTEIINQSRKEPDDVQS